MNRYSFTPSPLLQDLVAQFLVKHMQLPSEVTPAVTARAKWWLRKTHWPGESDDVAWFKRTIERIGKKTRHFKRLEGQITRP